MFTLPTLYGHDSKGKVKVWSICVEDGMGFFTITHGQQNGKMQVRETDCQPKNIGKVNETTSHSQAVIEAKARWKKQIDKGYTETLGEPTVVENPMLAHDFRKRKSSIVYPCYVQPKLDGVRCICRMVDGVIQMKSRGGKFYKVPKHIIPSLEKLFAQHETAILDGEIYIHGTPLQDIVSAVRNSPKKLPKTKTEANAEKYETIEEENARIAYNHPRLSYYVYDIVFEGVWKQRRKHVMFCKHHYTTVNLEFLADAEIASEEEVYEYHDGYVANGYEGVMIRNSMGEYRWNYRSADLQKYKEFMDKEFLIVGVERDNDGFGVPICQLNDTPTDSSDCLAVTFKATFKGTHKQRRAIYMERDNIIGKKATVKFQAYTNDGIPQFPVMLAIRDYD